MSIRTIAPAVVLLMLPAAALAQSNPWESTFGRKPKIWTDPDGRFSLDLPSGWTPMVTKDPSPNPVVITRVLGDSGQQAMLTVEMRTLPPGTRLTHFAQRVEEEVRGVARQYRLIDQDKVEVSGVPAKRTLFSYQQMAHAEMLAEVAQVMFIIGERGFVITLETGYGARGMFWEEFNIITKSFSGAAPGEETRSLRPGATRKSLEPGQMINPDVARY